MSAIDLDRRVARAIQCGRGIRLSDEDLRIVQACGALAMLEMAAADDETDPAVPAACPNCDPFIYLLQAGNDGPVKIGLSRKPEVRRVEHQTSSPQPLRFLAIFRAPAWFERCLHIHFGPEHVRGEWFHPSVRLLRFAGKVGVR